MLIGENRHFRVGVDSSMKFIFNGSFSFFCFAFLYVLILTCIHVIINTFLEFFRKNFRISRKKVPSPQQIAEKGL